MAAEKGFKQNRELSWLKFNERVLDEANDETSPLLTRFSFLSIFTTNLDEFFRVRVGSLFDCLNFVPDYTDSKTGMTAKEELNAVCRSVKYLYKARDRIFEKLCALLQEQGVQEVTVDALDKQKRKAAEKYFLHSVLPLLSPQIIDPRHPFPHPDNKQLHILVSLKKGNKRLYGLIPVPYSMERLWFPDENRNRFVLAENLLLYFADSIFHMYAVEKKAVICITRSADIDPDSDEMDREDDYRQHMKKILKKRERLSPVRLEIQGELPPAAVRFLTGKLKLRTNHVFYSKTPLDLTYCFRLQKRLPQLVEPSFVPVEPFSDKTVMSELIFQQDILLCYPYESMSPFLRLLKEASNSPQVVSIKITLYRLAEHSRLAQHLIEAAENGKDVTVLMELRARFDEQNNILWAQRLEEAGCHVIYGTENFKVHSKICLITYRDGEQIRHITQIGTGNYNEKTAKLYTDFSLMTAEREIGADAQEFFLNMSTGNLKGHYNSLWVAPANFKQSILERIDKEIEKARNQKPCGIFMKCNSLTDNDVISRLSEASCAGVRVRLLIRGICCLRPGIEGVTENIEVISIVGRFLEHARVYVFGSGDETEVYLSSGDMMSRNTERRVEISCPVQDGALKKRVLEYVRLQWNDNVKARKMRSDGSYHLRRPGRSVPLNAQNKLAELATQHWQDAAAASVQP